MSDRAGYNAPAMAFDSRRICLMELLAGKIRLILIYNANIWNIREITNLSSLFDWFISEGQWESSDIDAYCPHSITRPSYAGRMPSGSSEASSLYVGSWWER